MSALIKQEEQKQELDYLRGLVSIASKSGTNQMNPETMLNIMLTAKDLGISPMKAINGGFYVVNGKISMSTALMADRIRKEGHSIKIPEWTNQKCAVLGTRKDNGDSVKFEFTMEDAAAAGLVNSPTWKKFPKQMLYNRAMSTLARTLFPDVVGNAYSEDEKHDILNIPPERRPLEDPDAIEAAPSISDQKVEEPQMHRGSIEILRMYLESEKVDPSYLPDYINSLSEKWKKPVEKVIESGCKLISEFKAAYVRELAKHQSIERVTQIEEPLA